MTIAALTIIISSVTAMPKVALMPTQFDTSASGQVTEFYDDYLLTAVQELNAIDVIGTDDINALLDFEKRKEMLGCDDLSCMAEIGGALGVERIMLVRIARLNGEWGVTARLMNIQAAKVEARVKRFVKGDAKALLQDASMLVRKLLVAAKLLPESAIQEAIMANMSAPPGDSTKKLGLTVSVLGVIGLTAGVSVLAALGAKVGPTGKTYNYEGDDYIVDSAGACRSIDGRGQANYVANPNNCTEVNPLGLAIGAAVSAAALVITAVGTGMYLDGRAQNASGDPAAKGFSENRWLGWLFGLGGLGAGVGFAVGLESEALGWLAAGGGLAAGSYMFLSGIWSNDFTVRTPDSFAIMPDGRGGGSASLGWRF